MSRRLVAALVLIAVLVIVLILNAGPDVSVDFRLFSVEASKSGAFLRLRLWEP